MKKPKPEDERDPVTGLPINVEKPKPEEGGGFNAPDED